MGFGEAWARLAMLYIVVLVALLGLSMVLELWDCSCWFSIVVTYPWFRCFRVPFSFLLFSFSFFFLSTKGGVHGQSGPVVWCPKTRAISRNVVHSSL